MTLNRSTHTFTFSYIGPHNCEVTFTVLPFEANVNNASLLFNKIFMWFGCDSDSWTCSLSRNKVVMPRISNIKERFAFLKLYLNIVERSVVASADSQYHNLLTIIPLDTNGKSHYFNLTDCFVNLSAYATLLRCTCIIKTAFDELVQFADSKQGTTVLLKFR